MVFEGWREDILSLKTWFESLGLDLLGGWSDWRTPRASDLVPGM